MHLPAEKSSCLLTPNRYTWAPPSSLTPFASMLVRHANDLIKINSYFNVNQCTMLMTSKPYPQKQLKCRAGGLLFEQHSTPLPFTSQLLMYITPES